MTAATGPNRTKIEPQEASPGSDEAPAELDETGQKMTEGDSPANPVPTPRERLEGTIGERQDALAAAQAELGRLGAQVLRGEATAAGDLDSLRTRRDELRARIAGMQGEIAELQMTRAGLEAMEADDREAALEAQRAKVADELRALAGEITAAERTFLERVGAAVETAEEIRGLSAMYQRLAGACTRLGIHPAAFALRPSNPRHAFELLASPFRDPSVALEKFKGTIAEQPKPPAEAEAKEIVSG